MHKSIALALFTLVVAPAALRAQCQPFGTPCMSGMELLCSSAPQIGTAWTIGERNASACGNPTSVFTLIGGCVAPGVPIGPPLACTACGTCEWMVIPTSVIVQWTWPPRTTTIPIPNNRRLIGAMFCMQDVCANPLSACVCLSNAVQVTVQM